ncbi:MAG TPA: helix-turn-helix transcriptional regulator [Solirubrobacteraceae bacterium]|jgi:DNA-binding PadR family transcriptional regulator|nr:helix-turn-helix transcriptional regulator [Solirubrobacteraceae bacterium]
MARKTPPPMTSPVNWALLGLIIERESYAFELAQRFQKIYRNVISLSSTSHVYTALGVLEGRKLVDQIPGMRAGRQPKPNYRATAAGIESYGEWLVGYVNEDRRRQAMFVLGLSALASNASWVAEILDRYEQAWLEHDGSNGLLALDGQPDGPGAELIARIVPGENELTVAAKRSWVNHTRRALEEMVAKTSRE